MSEFISGLDARMVLDSRGNPTIELIVMLMAALQAAMVPSGHQLDNMKHLKCGMVIKASG